jgi:hypothetical protein
VLPIQEQSMVRRGETAAPLRGVRRDPVLDVSGTLPLPLPRDGLQAPCRWVFRSAAAGDADVAGLAASLNLPPALCRLLVQRGYGDAGQARQFLRPSLDTLHDPLLLAGAAAAVQRLRRAIEAGERILVHGDYDVDGICSAVLYTRVLRSLGGVAEPFVPHRMTDGYDLGHAGVRRGRRVGRRPDPHCRLRHRCVRRGGAGEGRRHRRRHHGPPHAGRDAAPGSGRASTPAAPDCRTLTRAWPAQAWRSSCARRWSRNWAATATRCSGTSTSWPWPPSPTSRRCGREPHPRPLRAARAARHAQHGAARTAGRRRRRPDSPLAAARSATGWRRA